MQAVLGKGDIVPARGLVGRVASLASRALTPWPVRGRGDECALTGACHAPPLPMCGLGGPSCGLRTATGGIGFAHALGVTVRGLNESARALRAAVGSDVIVGGHAFPTTGRERSRNWSLPLNGPSHGREVGGQRSRQNQVEAHGSFQDRSTSGLRVESVPAVAGSSIPQPMPSLQDLAKLFLSLSGSREQWDVVAGSAFSAASGPVLGHCLVPLHRCRWQLPPRVRLQVCPLWVGVLPLVLLLQVVQPVRGSTLGNPPALSGAAGTHLVAGVGLLSLPDFLFWVACPPPLRLLLWLRTYQRVRCLRPPTPPKLVVLARVVVALSVTTRLALVLRVWGWVHGLRRWPARSTRDGGRFSPSPLGAGDDDCFSTVDSRDLDRVDSFRAVLCLNLEFHSLEETASVAPPVFGLQSESSPALHLPVSSLLWSLLEYMNVVLAKFVEDQTVHGFLPVPGRRHRRYYLTSSSSFPDSYTVLFGDHALDFVRGHLLAGLVAFHVWEFP